MDFGLNLLSNILLGFCQFIPGLKVHPEPGALCKIRGLPLTLDNSSFSPFIADTIDRSAAFTDLVQQIQEGVMP